MGNGISPVTRDRMAQFQAHAEQRLFPRTAIGGKARMQWGNFTDARSHQHLSVIPRNALQSTQRCLLKARIQRQTHKRHLDTESSFTVLTITPIVVCPVASKARPGAPFAAGARAICLPAAERSDLGAFGHESVSRSFAVTRPTLTVCSRVFFAQNRFPVLRDMLQNRIVAARGYVRHTGNPSSRRAGFCSMAHKARWRFRKQKAAQSHRQTMPKPAQRRVFSATSISLRKRSIAAFLICDTRPVVTPRTAATS
jgi:hypothetical protein